MSMSVFRNFLIIKKVPGQSKKKKKNPCFIVKILYEVIQTVSSAFEEWPMHQIEQKAWWRAAREISLVTHRVCGHFLCSQRVSVSTPSAKRSHTRSPCTSFPFLSAVLHQFLQHWVKFRDAAATQSDDLTAGMTDDWNMRWCKSDAHVPMRPYPLPSATDMVL